MKISTLDEVRKLYVETAESYSKMMDSEIELPIYSDTFSRLYKRILNTPGPIVDTSCGSGHMLELYHSRYDARRSLIGIDLSPGMVEIASKRLGAETKTLVGDMCDLSMISSNSSAGVLSFFAIHHLDQDNLLIAFREWYRILCKGGQLLVAAWEGAGAIDYGDESDIIAVRYTKNEIESCAIESGFVIDRSVIEAVEEMPMDAIYIEASRL